MSASFNEAFLLQMLRGASAQEHFARACEHYKAMVEEVDPTRMAPCVVLLALSGKDFSDLEEFYKTGIADSAKGFIRLYESANRMGKRLPYEGENNSFIHFWSVLDRNYPDVANGRPFSAALGDFDKRLIEAEGSIGALEKAEDVGQLVTAIDQTLYSGVYFAALGDRLNAVSNERDVEAAFLKLVRDTVQRVVLKAVPPTGRPGHGNPKPAGRDGQR